MSVDLITKYKNRITIQCEFLSEEGIFFEFSLDPTLVIPHSEEGWIYWELEGVVRRRRRKAHSKMYRHIRYSKVFHIPSAQVLRCKRGFIRATRQKSFLDGL